MHQATRLLLNPPAITDLGTPVAAANSMQQVQGTKQTMSDLGQTSSQKDNLLTHDLLPVSQAEIQCMGA
jgi:hypothetical protein